ncbi:hypothetical protein BC936DRAFT_145619 [Jimgerdemannia flammicorona]|uniref:F-box domain-containing protein n=1 Tax=Jimgerdemannia flammicorona TaxID=994334 RepID=A0A433DLU5_9FUNG|nr:hypothetical protein BC936DRAFT_145619 [Jimgerdemannia flammicorona]
MDVSLCLPPSSSTMAGHFQTFTSTPRTFPKSVLRDINGNQVDVASLAEQYQLIVITLKASWCPVCPELLKILNVSGLRDDQDVYVDRFTHETTRMNPDTKKFNRLLLRHDAYFLIICPGPESELARIQRSVPFLSYPFICDTDLSLASDIRLRMSSDSDEIWPAILHIRPGGDLSVRAIWIGRVPGSYGQDALIEDLSTERFFVESRGVNAVRDAKQALHRLKRRAKKWERRPGGDVITHDMGLPHDTIPFSPPSTSTSTSAIASTSSTPPSPTAILTTPTTQTTIHSLPTELLFQILSCLPTALDTIRVAGTSRAWYLLACSVLSSQLRELVARVSPLLPKRDGNPVTVAQEVANTSLERPEEGGRPCGIRKLEARVLKLDETVGIVAKWDKGLGRRGGRELG